MLTPTKSLTIIFCLVYRTVPTVGPAIVAIYNTSSTTIYVQWEHSIPQKQVNGILIGYRVIWNDDHFDDDHPYNSKGYEDLGVDATSYTITSLHEYWLYNIGVAGRTSRGPGAYSRESVMTHDDGKSDSVLLLKFSVRKQ